MVYKIFQTFCGDLTLLILCIFDTMYGRYCLQLLKSIDRLLISSGFFQGKNNQLACNLKHCVFTQANGAAVETGTWPRHKFSVIVDTSGIILFFTGTHFYSAGLFNVIGLTKLGLKGPIATRYKQFQHNVKSFNALQS